MKDSARDMLAWSSFPYIRSADDLERYLEKRVRGHTNYFHYTTLKAIDGILKNGFCLSSADRLNDAVEKKVFEGKGLKYYALCFSTGVQENLSLWYLYSGVAGMGGRLRFSYRAVSGLISNPVCFLYEYDYEAHQQGKQIAVLTEENAKFRLEDVLYEDCGANGVELKYNTMTNRGKINEREWEVFTLRHKGFQKKQIWYYEKETRLLVELSDELFARLDQSKTYAVILSIPQDIEDEMEIRFAPNIKSFEDESVGKYEKILKLKGTSRLQLSDHSGEVEIDLCKKCKYKLEK